MLLALAAGAIVIFVLNSSSGGSAATETVVVTAKALTPGTQLFANASDTSSSNGNVTVTGVISDDFVTKQVNVNFAPADAYVFTSQQDLNVYLNKKVVTQQVLAGEILRTNDARFADVGSAAPGSLTNINPGGLKAGQILVAVNITDASSTASGASGKLVYVPGDHIDIIVTECGLAGARTSGCEVQTTFQDVTVYSTNNTAIWIAVDHNEAQQLAFLLSTGKASVGIRKPGDDATVQTTAVDASSIVAQFGY